jgi:hypothetical protein
MSDDRDSMPSRHKRYPVIPYEVRHDSVTSCVGQDGTVAALMERERPTVRSGGATHWRERRRQQLRCEGTWQRYSKLELQSTVRVGYVLSCTARC